MINGKFTLLYSCTAENEGILQYGWDAKYPDCFRYVPRIASGKYLFQIWRYRDVEIPYDKGELEAYGHEKAEQ